jgi:hypothetical protein
MWAIKVYTNLVVMCKQGFCGRAFRLAAGTEMWAVWRCISVAVMCRPIFCRRAFVIERWW